MKKIIIAITVLLAATNTLYCQTEDSPIKMAVEPLENTELADYLMFEEINFLKTKFVGGKELKNKNFTISAKSYIDGKLVLDAMIVDSKFAGAKYEQQGDENVLNIKILAKKNSFGKMKMMLAFPYFGVHREFDLVESEDVYLLKNLMEESSLPIKYGESFPFLAYVLPYDMGGGMKSYCAIGSSGTDVENWGTKFKIKHYIIFEMMFE